MSYLVKIGTTELPKIRKYKVGRNKLWTDADRDLSGALHSTYINRFPKISLEFGYLTQAEMKALVNLLDQPQFQVSWYDIGVDDYSTGTYYASDYEVSTYDVERGLYEPMTVSLVPWEGQE